jgi:hypothetical protein
MDQIQIFQGRAADLTTETNDWLKTNNVEKIQFVTQSESEGGAGTTKLTISIWD